MKMKVILFAALVGLLSANYVEVLDDRTWEEFVQNNKYVMIEWYAPWCGHCKALEPEYNNASVRLHNDKTRMTVLAKIDATENKFSAQINGVNGYPTLKYFVNGVSVDYKGARKAAAIYEWTGIKEKPVAKQLDTKEQYDKFKISSDFVTIAFLEKDSKESAIFNAHANEYTMTKDGIVYGECTNPELAAKLGVDKIPSVQMFRFPSEFDELPMMVTADWSENKDFLASFYDDNRFLPISEIDAKNYKAYMSRGRPVVWLGLDTVSGLEETVQVHQAHVDVLKPFAEKMTHLSFVYINCKKFDALCTNIGLTARPSIVVRNTALDNRDVKYRLLDEFTADNLETFFEAYEEKTLEPYVKSENAPRIQGAVHKVVGSTYDEFVKQDKFMLLAFVAPWCGHCRELKPKYKAVAKHFKTLEHRRTDVIIAEIDATANDFPVDVKRFPTLMWYGRDPIPSEFQGGRETSRDIITWVDASIADYERQLQAKTAMGKTPAEEAKIESAPTECHAPTEDGEEGKCTAEPAATTEEKVEL